MDRDEKAWTVNSGLIAGGDLETLHGNGSNTAGFKPENEAQICTAQKQFLRTKHFKFNIGNAKNLLVSKMCCGKEETACSN